MFHFKVHACYRNQRWQNEEIFKWFNSSAESNENQTELATEYMKNGLYRVEKEIRIEQNETTKEIQSSQAEINIIIKNEEK